MLTDSNIWSSFPNVSTAYCLEQKLHLLVILLQSGPENRSVFLLAFESTDTVPYKGQHELALQMQRPPVPRSTPASLWLSDVLEVLNYSQLETDSFRGEYQFLVMTPFGLIP